MTRGQLCRTAVGPRAARHRRRRPRLAAIGDLQRGESAAHARIELSRRRRANDDDIRCRGVDLLAVRGHAPLHAAVDAALRDARLPHDLAVLLRIERPDDAGLLPSEQQLAPARRRHQNRRRSEVVVRTASRGASRTFRFRRARRVVHVVRVQLLRPDHAACVEVERHHRIARRRHRRRIVVAGRDVEAPPLHDRALAWTRSRRPEGPQVSTPPGVFPVRSGARGIVCVFHTTLPSRTRSAVTLPRNVQHGYSGFSARDSSHDDAPMYATPSTTRGGALRRTASCSSGRLRQTSFPVAASSA